MKKYILYLIIASLQLFLFISCSSVDSDAKAAAEAIQKSIEYTADGKLEKAETYFKQYKEIEDKYKGTKDYNTFVEAYQGFAMELQGISE